MPAEPPDTLGGMPEKSRLRQRLSSWASSSDQHARDLRQHFQESGVVAIEAAPDRELVCVRGTLRTVTLRPRGGVPALEAELYDGSGVVTLLWLGRRRIAGIAPGRAIQVTGRIGVHERARVMFNPRYELMP